MPAPVSNRKMWFGTEQFASWIPAPLSGADTSPAGWSADAQLLSGGAMQRNSWASHKEYVFDWPESSTRQAQQLMQSYANGTYGRGLIYFHDPLTHDINVLPPFYADPSMAEGFEAPPLVLDVDPAITETPDNANMLPLRTATYAVPTAGIDSALALYVPIPDGYDLHIGSVYSQTGTGGVFASPVTQAGTTLSPVALTELGVSATNLHPDTFSSTTYRAVRLWVGKTSATASTVTVTAMTARLYRTGEAGDYTGWYGGQGHTGCAFAGKPTRIAYSGVSGGQVGYAVTLRETGAWL